MRKGQPTRTAPDHPHRDGRRWTLRLGHVAPGVLLATLAVIAAVATISTSIGGLYWVGGAMALATTIGLVNSWVLLVEIKR